ncbi:MAG: hypothetical protein L3K05_02645, partial [Thermoplasmata archaeon]|nr:hypothetical protein [Thermoplasmata archaeon]
NGAMALDRDLHVAVATAWASGRGAPASGWEMLAATGVRGLRVLVESGALARLLSTDSGGPASAVLTANTARFAECGASSRRWDARRPPPEGPFGHVDLDPFGSPLPFLDAAFDSLAPGGLLSVTATDMIVLAGVDAEATRRRYGATPVRGRLGPEGGLRILLRTLSDRSAARGRRIHPLLAYLRDHYVRAYVVVRSGDGPIPVGEIEGDRWNGPPLGTRAPVGPMWLGPLFDRAFLERLQVPPGAVHPGPLAALLGRFRDESVADVPFYFEPNTIAKENGLSAPPSTDRLIEALRARGHSSGRTHARDGAFRTTATRADVYEVATALPVHVHRPSPAGTRTGSPSGVEAP